jgi:hypothetical protein
MVILPHRRKAFRTESGSGGDPYFANVVWLLHCETSAFLDSSPAARTPSLGSSPSASTPAKYGTNAYQANASSFIAAYSPSDFAFGTGDFTVEMWIRYPSGALSNARTLFDCRPGAVNGPYMAAGIAVTGIFSVNLGTSGAGIVTLNSASALAVDTWYHVAVSRSGSTARLFIDGVLSDTKTSTLSIANDRLILSVNQFVPSLAWVGSIDEVRVTKGVARYTANFTPPTAAFPDSIPSGNDPFGTSVALLLHCDGTNGSTTFTDNSPSPKTVTASGNAQVTTTNPKFGTGAMLLDGSFDFATVPSSTDFNFGAGDFTIEFWLNWSSLVGFQTVLERNYISTGGFAIQSGNGTGRLIFYLSGSVIAQESVSAVINTWYFYAITRSGTTVRMYRNGVQLGSGTSSVNITSSAILGIGGRSANGLNCFNGRIDDLRITTGIARYIYDFVPPTAALLDPGNVFTSYLNPLGSGDRTATITVSKSAGADIRGPLSRFVGLGASNTYFENVPNGEWLKFDFGAAKVIDELKYYQQLAVSQGTWQLEGSNDDSTWTTVGIPFEITGTTFVSVGAFSSNTNSYRYYRIKKTAGTVNRSPWAYQFEFKISA